MNQSTEIGVLDNDVMSLDRIAAVLPKLLPGLIVAWSTTSADEAVRRCLDPQWRPALLVTDVELDGTTAMEVARRIRREDGMLPILAMSSYSPREYAHQLSEAGAQGLMVKGDMAQMATALRRVLMGESFSPVANVAFPTPSDAHRQAQACKHSDAPDLSEIETQVLKQTSEGFSTEEIAASLSISPATVRSHTRNIREKLGAKTLSHAVAIWLLHDADRKPGSA
ncbi:MAG: response regulator transcription factor [Bifidobacterium tibiigranuli]|uniref:response regulator transcription factor n=1 Tax=Bifidobacterium tibiigranuli TaxID=2172043 RepID=UPI00235522E8|nr:response regulator transcription factor [Bifidobacterium tibiigranuli]MCH3974615.1 response regulator transcription factor [Bifidobacterium tibiigranuli]MCH4189660.1 response regulator transcription factor [Bifidobacterium tibiigranuli]MCH4203583.1 response regulator transcription factor [Bifidobacterium tibiigranuli]MCH4274210.1 response regulator transcription factor [Bifidobacterium tibiigranuli]MCI1792104.1 response regulator transcription factor [Bifidobacterium tibiigranuli]